MAIVYTHRRLDTDEVFYVGIGTRTKRAASIGDRNDIWRKIVAKTDYTVKIEFNNITIEEAKRIEQKLIAFYGRINLCTGTLSNMTDGGDGGVKVVRSKESIEAQRNKMLGRKWSDEHKAKIGAAHKGKIITPEARAKCSATKLGVKMSDEARLKMSESHKGKTKSNETKARMSAARKLRELNKKQLV